MKLDIALNTFSIIAKVRITTQRRAPNKQKPANKRPIKRAIKKILPIIFEYFEKIPSFLKRFSNFFFILPTLFRFCLN